MASDVKSVAVIGGGVSGLAAAYKLKSRGVSVTLFEADERAGGKIRSVSRDGFIWDEGANTMTESDAEVGRLLDNLGIRDKQQFPISQNKRYIARNGKPELIPTDPIALIKSSFLSSQSKFQIILEPFLWNSTKKNNLSKVSNESSNESVGEFFERHFGKEVVDYLIDPFVAGSSAGDPDSLSMPYAFPELWNLEKKFGSVIVGSLRSKLFKKREEKGENVASSGKIKHRRGSFSFQGGMQTFTDSLFQEIGDNLKLKAKVLSLSYNHNGISLSDNWSVSYATDHKEASPDKSFDAVIMTAPLCNLKEMKITRSGSPFMLDFLPEVNYLPLSVIITAFKKENVKRPLEGFGVLVPSKEQQNGLKTLGTLFSSMMFPDRAPSDMHMFTTFVGGSRNRDLAKASLNELNQAVTSDLRRLLGAEGEPTYVKSSGAFMYLLVFRTLRAAPLKRLYNHLFLVLVFKTVAKMVTAKPGSRGHFFWSKAFPLYGHDYGSVLEAVEKMEENLPGFFYAGNHRGGLSVGKSLTSGCKAADLVISYLNSSYSSENFP
ncbi:hypothetical protein GIB67_020312 [Kingdonia uniflora]|uniref:Protoporphyrinogen oxidase n=1 Tax=Kingdonia uniflora TaxID=39325 RepID=A0A7J7NJ01_9MAGN|nr:hypothetical protein GIB67_020312 [Kingdonia uniflora]